MSNFTEKGFGRIYVDCPADVVSLSKLIHELDPYEADNYFPPDLIALVDEYPRVVYIGKFEPDFDIAAAAAARNLKVFVFDSGEEALPEGYYPPALTRDEIKDKLKSNVALSDIGHILRLAEIIREVDGGNQLGAAALAEAILEHPGFSGCHDGLTDLSAQGSND